MVPGVSGRRVGLNRMHGTQSPKGAAPALTKLSLSSSCPGFAFGPGSDTVPACTGGL